MITVSQLLGVLPRAISVCGALTHVDSWHDAGLDTGPFLARVALTR